jgi:hypothetical protein
MDLISWNIGDVTITRIPDMVVNGTEPSEHPYWLRA